MTRRVRARRAIGALIDTKAVEKVEAHIADTAQKCAKNRQSSASAASLECGIVGIDESMISTRDRLVRKAASAAKALNTTPMVPEVKYLCMGGSDR